MPKPEKEEKSALVGRFVIRVLDFLGYLRGSSFVIYGALSSPAVCPKPPYPSAIQVSVQVWQRGCSLMKCDAFASHLPG